MGMVELALIGKLKKTKADKLTTYTKTEVDNLLSNFNGVNYYSSLNMPTNISAGTIWFNQTNGVTYIYQEDSLGTKFWVELGGGSSAINVPILSESNLIIVSNISTKTYNFVYETSFIQVFINRLKLRKSEFTATNGTSITINIDLEIGDEIEFVTVEGI